VKILIILVLIIEVIKESYFLQINFKLRLCKK